jgi:hypothetical protein
MIYDTIPNSVEGSSFQWFHGVVEDVNDPEEMGRVRVRCIGYHTNDVSLLPVSSLPWATPILPFTSASMSSIGVSATGILRGSWVIGFFRDGISAQDPVILGTIPSVSTKRTEGGFKDPTLSNPRFPGEIDTPRDATSSYASSPVFLTKKELRQEKVETAVPPKVTSVAPDGAASYYTRKTWNSIPTETVVQPTYPKNQVFESESGHVVEYDDTPGYERISQFHKSGTYKEIVADGSQTTTVVGDNYKVIFKNNNVYVKGNCNLTIDGDCRTLVKGNYHLEVEGNYTQYIKGSKQIKTGGSEQTEIGHERSYNISSNVKGNVNGYEAKIISGNFDLTVNQNMTTTVVKDYSLISFEDVSLASGASSNITALTTLNTTSGESTNVTATAKVIVIGSRIDLN